MTPQWRTWMLWDEQTTARIAGWFAARPWLRRLAGLLSDATSSVFIVPLGLILWRLGGAYEPLAVRVVLGSLASSVATLGLKGVFRRKRPPGAQGVFLGLDRHSFPSGHTLRAACLVWWLAPLLPTWGAVLIAMTALVVGLCRVGAGAHHAGDVLAGWVAGSAVGLLLLWLM